MVSFKLILFLTTAMIVIVFNVDNVNAGITDPYELFTIAYTTLGLDETSLLPPKDWCTQYADSVNSFMLDKVKSCKVEKDGRYVLKIIYFEKSTREMFRKSIFTKAYNEYVLSTVKSIIDQADVKIPSKFCSSRRALGPTQEQLESLSLAGLDAPSFKDFDQHNTHEELAIISQTDRDTLLSFEHN